MTRPRQCPAPQSRCISQSGLGAPPHAPSSSRPAALAAVTPMRGDDGASISSTPRPLSRHCSGSCLTRKPKRSRRRLVGDAHRPALLTSSRQITCRLSPNERAARPGGAKHCGPCGPRSAAAQPRSGDPRLSGCGLRISGLGSPARSLNFLHNHILMIVAHKCFQQSHDTTPSPHLRQQPRLPPEPPPAPSCSTYYLLLVKDPPPPLVDLETKILGAPFTYISQHFFVF